MFELSAGPNPFPDFEEALRVIKIDDTHYGAHPLRLPIQGARGVYGGHMMAQSLLVGIESTRDEKQIKFSYLIHTICILLEQEMPKFPWIIQLKNCMMMKI